MPTHNLEFSLCALLLKNEKQKANDIYLRQPRNGEWTEYSWKEVMHRVRQLVAFFHEKCLKKGDHVAIISKNCAEWFIADFAIAFSGMVSVPLFANQNQENIEFILEHAEVKLVLAGKLDHPQMMRDHIPRNYPVLNMDYHPELKTDYHWPEVLSQDPVKELHCPDLAETYTIIYSSGTSGKPKGALYTHQAVANYLKHYPDDIRRITNATQFRLVSYLPLAHVYERTAIALGSLTIPATVSFVESLEKFADNLREIEPSMFTAVPRIWGVFKQKIEQKLPPVLLNILLAIPGIKQIISKKVKHELGFSRCTNFVSGASHLPVDIILFFKKLGIVIQEGYGQTENMAYATLNMLDNYQLGTVGSPRLGVEIKKGEENELLIRSDCLMDAYYKQPDKTAETMTADGWLKTGDIVEIDAGQRVKILGRLSDVFKNQKGEFVQPTPVEKKFGENQWIEYLCLVGQGLAKNIMIVNLSASGKSLSREAISQLLKEQMRKANMSLQSYEKMSHVLVVNDIWDVENDLLTPTLKVKRRRVNEVYHDLIIKTAKEDEVIVFADDIKG